MILRIVYYFLWGVAIFHIAVVGLQHGIDRGNSLIRALSREFVRAIIRISSMLYLYQKQSKLKKIGQKKQQKSYFIRGARVGVVSLCIVSILFSLWEKQSLYAIMIGFKYTLWPLCIGLTAITLGWYSARTESIDVTVVQKRCQRIFYLCIGIMVIGLCVQISKHLFPQLRTWRGYGPVGNFVFDQAPPLYYRTGPGGWPRLSGIFAGPNNYGFFLVGITSLLWFTPLSRSSRHKTLYRILHVISTLASLSRGALLAVGAQLVWGYTRIYSWKSKYVLTSIVAGLSFLIGLFLLKPGSTLEHITNKRDSIHLIRTQPRGSGLGSAGAAVFHVDAILPENMFIQIIADIGLWGLLRRVMLIALYLWHTHQTLQKKSPPPIITQIRYLMTRGILALLGEGIFLHVWDDSMVNYLLLIPWGILGGYLLGYRSIYTASGKHTIQ